MCPNCLGPNFSISRGSRRFSLEEIFTDGNSLGALLQIHILRRQDLEAGQRSFGEQCAVCHGADAKGLHAPPLDRPGFKHGDSDLRIYKVIRDGVSNTAMTRPNLSMVERWQVVGYLRNLQLHFAARMLRTLRINIPKVTSQQIESKRDRASG